MKTDTTEAKEIHGAKGWGSYAQVKSGKQTSYTLELAHGELKMEQLELPFFGKKEIKSIDISLNGDELEASAKLIAGDVIINFKEKVNLQTDDYLTIQIK